MSIALLGTGRMGSAFARALLAGGADLTVWNRTSGKLDALVDLDATPALSVADAVGAAETVLVVVLDQPAVRELLSGLVLAGKTVVNYTTGTSSDAEAARDLVVAAGGRYVDAVISGAPSDIGGGGTTIYYAGDHEAYGRLACTLGLLSGLRPFVGLRVGNANVLEEAWVGGFKGAAIRGFREAVSFAVGEGVSIETMVDSIDHHLGRLRKDLLDSARQADGW